MKGLDVGNNRTSLGDGWVTMDLSDADIIHDCLVTPWPFEDRSFDVVYMSHVLEHLPWWKSVDVLREAKRVLKPGGSIEVHVPDFWKIVREYLDGVPIHDDWDTLNPMLIPGLWLNGRIMCGPVDEEKRGEQWWHRSVFDRRHLTWCLRMAGYKDVREVPERVIRHGWINLGLAATA